MICFRLARAIVAVSAVFGAIVISGCGSGSSPAPCAAVTGQTTTSTGSSAGNDNYSLGLGSGCIHFSNLNLTFYTLTIGTEIVDAGYAGQAYLTSWLLSGTASRLSRVIA